MEKERISNKRQAFKILNFAGINMMQFILPGRFFGLRFPGSRENILGFFWFLGGVAISYQPPATCRLACLCCRDEKGENKYERNTWRAQGPNASCAFYVGSWVVDLSPDLFFFFFWWIDVWSSKL